ncbi:MAG TPA: D-2-hydroxyacid dehydrogenase [Candidatus Polarisedimenticolaceae bacterium]
MRTRTFLLAFMMSSVAAAPRASDALVAELGLEVSPVASRDLPGWRVPKKVVAPGSDPARLAFLREALPGVEVVGASSAEEAAAAAPGAEVVLGFCTPAVVAAAKDLKWIQVMSAGVEHCVSIPEVRERKLVITNMQRVMGPVIAEHVIGMALALNRGFPAYLSRQPAGAWDPDAAPGLRVLKGKTMLVAGLGGIGTEVARRAHALGMRVVATRASGKTGPDFVSYVGLPDELLKLAAEADVVVNALPLTPATTNLFDAKFFAAVKHGATFVNVGRGKSVATDALVAALREGKLAGAGLDVTEPEPLPKDHPLWRLPNVIVTPHVAAQSDLGRETQWRIARENLRRYVAGEPLLSVVDAGRGY